MIDSHLETFFLADGQDRPADQGDARVRHRAETRRGGFPVNCCLLPSQVTSFVTCVFASDQVLPEAEVRQLRGGARPVALHHAGREPASQGKEKAFEDEITMI